MLRGELEKIIFSGLSWSSDQKSDFLRRWEGHIFKEVKKHASISKERWVQCRAIDRETAAKIIRYFIDQFLVDPRSRRQYGEIACLLWTCVWASQEYQGTVFRIHEILNLTTKQFDKENITLQIRQNEVSISYGLCKLLTCLLGKGRGKRSLHLFENITSLDYLEDALKMASKTILGSEAIPVLPAAFLLFPHPFNGKRLSANRCQATSKTDELRYKLPHSRSDLIRAFKKTHNACGIG